LDLLYKIEMRGSSLLVRLEEQGSKRILYLDTLKAIAKESDREALALLIRIHLRTTRNPDTLSFQLIEVPSPHVKDAIRLMEKTGRLIGKKEAPPANVPLDAIPRLVLKDATGCFATLWMDYGIEVVPFLDFSPTIQGRPRLKKEEKQFEKDLLESGFIRKTVGDSDYYIPTDKVKEALTLLVDVGWQVRDMRGNRVVKQGKSEIDIREENGTIIVSGKVHFGERSVSIKAISGQRMWVELDDESVGLIERKIEIEGEWKEDSLTLPKRQIGALLPLLESAHWEETLRTCAEGLKNGISIEKAEPGGSFRGELLVYQQKGVDWLSFLHRFGFSALLADEMGLGKTVQVLAFLSRLGTNLPVLIVAPTSLLFNWRNEIARFLTCHHNIVLTSYTTLRLNEERYTGQEFEVVVLDESNAIKTATTQTAKAACKLKARFKICMSGTPLENRLDEILSQFHFLMPDLIEKKSELESVKKKVRPFILRRRKEEVQLDLPEKIEQIAWVEMDEAQKEFYDTYRNGVQIEGLKQMEILEAILRLRQICCDPRLVDSDIPSAKMERLIADVKEALEQKRKVLIFSQFTSALSLIRQEFQDALYLDGSTPQEKREEQVRLFQEDPNSSLFLLSLKAGGVGLNLTAADYVFLFDPWWNDAVEQQAIDRAHRIGQKKTVIAKRYLTVGTIEEKMLQLKSKKQQTADQLLDFEGGHLTHEDLLDLLST